MMLLIIHSGTVLGALPFPVLYVSLLVTRRTWWSSTALHHSVGTLVLADFGNTVLLFQIQSPVFVLLIRSRLLKSDTSVLLFWNLPCVTQQLPSSCLFHTRQCIDVSAHSHRWEAGGVGGGLWGSGYVYTHSWLTLLYSRSKHNIVNNYSPTKKI